MPPEVYLSPTHEKEFTHHSHVFFRWYRRILWRCPRFIFWRVWRHAFRRYYWRTQWRDIFQHVRLWPSGHKYEWRRIQK